MEPSKYPSTPHLPWSESLTNDDKLISTMEILKNAQEIVVTEKLDGENCNMYRDYIHARSMNSNYHVSRDYVRAIHAQIAHQIPSTFKIVGENMYAVHSINYSHLPQYFFVFAIFEEDICLPWSEVEEWCSLIEYSVNGKTLQLQTAPVLYKGKYDEAKIKACYTGESKFGGKQEGYVVRNTRAFHTRHFDVNVAKFVRANHVQPNAQHWMSAPVVPNQLIKDV